MYLDDLKYTVFQRFKWIIKILRIGFFCRQKNLGKIIISIGNMIYCYPKDSNWVYKSAKVCGQTKFRGNTCFWNLINYRVVKVRFDIIDKERFILISTLKVCNRVSWKVPLAVNERPPPTVSTHCSLVANALSIEVHTQTTMKSSRCRLW